MLMFSSCTRIDTTEMVDYTFTNTMSVPLTLDVYPSMDDYNRNTNLIHAYPLAPGASAIIPLEFGRTYGLDWYSADYGYSNWVDRDNTQATTIRTLSPMAALAPSALGDHLSLTVNAADTTRSIFLNGSGTSSSWKLTIDDTTLYKGTHTLTFRKDFHCDYTGLTSITLNRQFKYDVVNAIPPRFYVNVNGDDGIPFAIVYFGGTGPNPVFNRDTLKLRFYSDIANHLYPLIRQ
jgi:hypothetical protein